ncbi:MAG: type II toxin-antitoxin system RelE/ParE family toxin [Desulfococcaceae bacterium]|jgi:mRNA-degrading endonuclease RelE of RelBE toxin-antitoxin system|nr:type II toxin-antitoxin system RelE/ParE family toxin [Desulfococcaceae bacterium]
MPTEDTTRIYIRFTPEFKRNLRALAKKYRHIRSDVQPLINEIQKGNFIGDQIPGTKGYTVFKVRVKNTDSRKGKRSGYRFIYYLKTHNEVILITIYSKNEQTDISPEQLRQILKKSNEKNDNI